MRPALALAIAVLGLLGVGLLAGEMRRGSVVVKANVVVKAHADANTNGGRAADVAAIAGGNDDHRSPAANAADAVDAVNAVNRANAAPVTPAVRFAVGLRDETCACEDRDCLAQVNARWSRRLGQVHVSDGEQASFGAALQEATACTLRLPPAPGDPDETE